MTKKRQTWDDDKMSYVEFELEPFDPERERKGALTICDYAQDATLARELMDMLGLYP